MLQQVAEGIKISGDGKIEEEIKHQMNKANRAAGCLNDTIWKNKHISVIIRYNNDVPEMDGNILTTSCWLHVELGKNI
jgi:hypothetical protein